MSILILVPTLTWECEIKIVVLLLAGCLKKLNVHGYCALYGKEPSCSTAAGYGTLYIVRICISQYDMLGYSQVPHVFKEL